MNDSRLFGVAGTACIMLIVGAVLLLVWVAGRRKTHAEGMYRGAVMLIPSFAGLFGVQFVQIERPELAQRYLGVMMLVLLVWTINAGVTLWDEIRSRSESKAAESLPQMIRTHWAEPDK